MNARSYLFSLEKLGIKFGLENITALSGALGHPERAYPSVIIAGTNGKGSVAAMVEQGLREAGFTTGLYTSPHLVHLEERFRVNGKPVSEAELDAAAETAREAVTSLRVSNRLVVEPTFFEVTTAVGFEIFRQRQVTFGVLEVGMGGRYDATNIATPVAGAITTIDFDHQQYLGHTLGEIAAEKAGIVKAGMPLVVGERREEPLRVIANACRERQARMVLAHEDIDRHVTATADGRLQLSLTTPRRRYPTMPLALRGRHQVDNAIVAIRLLEELEGLGFPVSEDTIVGAATRTRWPGRLEMIERPGGRKLLCDAAHNPAGAQVLASYLKEFHPGGIPLVFAIMRDKDLAGTLGPLVPWARPLVVTRPSLARAQELEVVADSARKLGATEVEADSSVPGALERAWSRSPLIAVAGSIFLVGEVLEFLGREPGDHAA